MIELVYVTQDNCGMCNYFKPTFNRICREQGWSSREVNSKTIMPLLTNLRVGKTPTILVYLDSVYKGKIEGVKRSATIIKEIRDLTS